jgi:hypothetical protein
MEIFFHCLLVWIVMNKKWCWNPCLSPCHVFDDLLMYVVRMLVIIFSLI